jgi:hypothetical protein
VEQDEEDQEDRDEDLQDGQCGLEHRPTRIAPAGRDRPRQG